MCVLCVVVLSAVCCGDGVVMNGSKQEPGGDKKRETCKTEGLRWYGMETDVS